MAFAPPAWPLPSIGGRPPWAASAADSGTVLRLKRAMTVLVLGKNLWQTLWLNVLPRDRFFELVPPGPEDMPHRFPWMGPVARSTRR